MSAYVVDRDLISFLASLTVSQAFKRDRKFSYYYNGEWKGDGTLESAVAIGQILWDENIKSVLFLYREKTRDKMPGPIGDDFVLTIHDIFFVLGVSHVEIFKACHCLEYQSCETAEWERSETHAIISAIKEHTARIMPGYNEAEWGAPASYKYSYYRRRAELN